MSKDLRQVKLGRRGRVGLIMPAVQVVTEPLYYAIAPEGVSFHASRLVQSGSDVAAIEAMDRSLDKAIEELVQARVDCIAYSCTVGGILKGLKEERSFWAGVEARTGIRTTTALLSIIEALEQFKIRRLVITSPYPEELDRLENKFFEANGYEVVTIRSLNVPDARQIAEVMPDEVYQFSKRVWRPGADGLFISCLNLNAMPVIASLEAELQVPVVTSHSAMLWKVLKLLGIREPLTGFGRLLSMGI